MICFANVTLVLFTDTLLIVVFLPANSSAETSQTGGGGGVLITVFTIGVQKALYSLR